MKILLVTDFFYPRYGGIATHVHGLAKSLEKIGYAPIILTTAGNKTGFDTYDGIPVYRYPSPVALTFLVGLEKLRKNIKFIVSTINPDILHAHHAFSPLGTITPLIGRELNIPTVLTNHSIPPAYYSAKELWYRVAKLLRTYSILRGLRAYNRVIAVSHVAADFISKFYHGKITIIPNAIFLEEFNVNVSRKELGIPEDDFVVLMVGRSSPRKGYEVALLAFKKVVKKMPNAHLYVIGVSGFQKAFIIGLAKLMKIEENVHVLGYLPRETLIKYYKVADVFLHAAYGGESFGIVLLEAMAAGTPIVSTSGDGLKAVLKNSGAGICVDIPSPIKISASIIMLLKDPELRRRMGENGKNYVKRYSWDYVIREIKNVYTELKSGAKTFQY